MRIVLCFAAALPVLAASCDSLSSLKLPDTAISSVKLVAAGAFAPPQGNAAPYKNLPEFCRVEGVIAPTSDSHIAFEVWLPSAGWNHRYLGVGNGGFAGSISYSEMAAGLRTGYAVSSTDTGHEAGATDAAWALNHFEKIVDYAYRATHETADKSKAVIRAFYGSAASHNYFNGCSNGGRQAMVEVQRYPADYDGVIAGAPAANLTHLLADFAWDMQALDESPSTYISSAQWRTVETAAVAACDANDGVTDGVIGDPTKCHFDPSVLACKGAPSKECLTDAQIGALNKVYQGASNSKGVRIHPGYEPGGESGFGGWPLWISGVQQGHSLQHAFAQGFFSDMMYSDAAWDYKTFNFDKDVPATDDKMGPIFNGTNADLSKFKSRGGKLIIYHGWSDAAISPLDSVNYYNAVAAKLGQKQAGEFVDLYMVPGMQHCGGGPGVTSFAAPMTSAIEQWVESKKAPGEIVATKYKQDGVASSGVLRTRPICPYPQAAKYKGSGSTDDAANFTCSAN
ncbi:MAG TPA: tannase/feruloyl esterase family alpha/beta hydrolase [Bryobacteraceae bacterium]|nr:tannase/feruloyl esterase family alpha/beta hydrolase [Bryobacteraceae bacterium]